MSDHQDHDHCAICFKPIVLAYYHARLVHQDRWAVMCPACFDFFGAGLGKGHGYKVSRIHGEWVTQTVEHEEAVPVTG